MIFSYLDDRNYSTITVPFMSLCPSPQNSAHLNMYVPAVDVSNIINPSLSVCTFIVSNSAPCSVSILLILSFTFSPFLTVITLGEYAHLFASTVMIRYSSAAGVVVVSVVGVFAHVCVDTTVVSVPVAVVSVCGVVVAQPANNNAGTRINNLFISFCVSK